MELLASSKSDNFATSHMSGSVTLRISRFSPNENTSPTFEEFRVPVKKWTTVLETILYVKQNLDHSIAVRYSCRQGACGSCGMRINGYPRLACSTKISDLVTVEPMYNFPVLRDLAVDMTQMFSTHKKMKPYIINDESELGSGKKELLQTPKDVENYLQFSLLYKVRIV